MPLKINAGAPPVLSESELAAWKTLPASIIGDELDRSQIMQAAIKALAPGSVFAALAVTVETMVGDNLASHHAIQHAGPGEVLVVDAQGFEDTAVWGEVMHTAARARGIEAIVVDGAVRDSAALRASSLPVFARACVPAGPHKGFGGAVNAPISCGGVAVNPGDLVVGDDDGVVVVRPAQLDGLLARCRERLKLEAGILERMSRGESNVTVLGLREPD